MKRNKTGVGDPPPNADQNETENKYKDKPRKRDDIIRIEFKKSTILKLSFLSLIFLIGATLYFGFKEKLFNFTYEYNHCTNLSHWLTEFLMHMYEFLF